MQPFIAGAISGLTATVPMTAAMETMFPRLPWYERYPLPPRKVTLEVIETLGLKSKLDENQCHGLTVASHLGYGAAMGMAYSLVARRALPGVVGGAIFGLGVWAGSYLAALPVAKLHPHAAREPADRNALMIAAHVVWGTALGALFARFQSATTD
jgi:uncharacterized membrane protein YagU involved in acid resistance